MSNINELLDISQYLTHEYLNQQMTTWFNKEVKYTRHEFGEGTGKGDSYLSDVYRITFYGNTEENVEVSIKTILKSLPKNIARRKTFRSEGFFRNEINFYLYILPVLLEFQAEKNIDDPFECCPRVFAAVTDGQNDFLALEDLSIYNFTTAVRQEGIDYAHCEVTLECFAKLHALSFAYKDQHPDSFAKLKEIIEEMYYNRKHWDWYRNFWKLACNCAIDSVEKEYPDTIYLEKAKAFATEKTLDRMEAATIDTTNGVFSHGDSWTPNFLFKYDPKTNRPTDAKMIDFQLGRCASPILDIGFFIYACSTEDLRKEYYDSMLKHYHGILSKQIRAMGSDPEKIYSWNVFMDDVKKYSFFGLGFSFESTPVIILEPEDAFDMDLKGTEAVDISTIWTLKPIKSKNGRLRLSGNIKHAVDNGFI
ncbi:uncharacterized protein LOC143911679 [Arctopsyche grandis]|uniref:uncharacterized protein LOC143911679 n=1 Tax=Arctopsyche grandis TaxID=121162 RepID=UPI00406DA4B2